MVQYIETMIGTLKRFVVIILTWEARLVLRRYKPHIIAVTGSVGKTTTKDAIFAALSPHFFMRKSEKSFNSELGVPLTILGLETGWRNPLAWALNIMRGALIIILGAPYPQWLVLEVGADRPGDIRSIARWLRPDIAVITGVPEVPVHVEYFSSPEEVVREKRALAEYVKPGGAVILNGDDMRMREIYNAFRGVSHTYGFGNDNDYAASHDEVLYEDGTATGMYFRVNHGGSSVPVSVSGALGAPRVYGALAALAVAEEVGVDFVSASTSLTSWTPPPGRMRIVQGLRGSTIIDDTYNSSPVAALSALDTLRSMRTHGRRIAILGDMLELGKYSADAHRSVGARAAQSADLLITVGFRARAIAEAALDNGLRDLNVRSYERHESQRAGRELKEEIQPGDIILVKGSQSMRMERTVLELMAEPAKASELLVRQDAEWLSR